MKDPTHIDPDELDWSLLLLMEVCWLDPRRGLLVNPRMRSEKAAHNGQMAIEDQYVSVPPIVYVPYSLYQLNQY